MKKNYLLLIIQLISLACVFSLQAQTSFESHIVVSGDTTVLNIDNYTVGDIQWQTKDSLFGIWGNIQGATDTSLVIPFTGFVSPEKYYRAILLNNSNGDTYYTDANRFEIKDSIADVSVGEKYAGGYVFLNQNSFMYIVGEPEFQAPWGCYGTEINGADGEGIGDGVQNTQDIIQQCQEDSTAAWLCDKLILNGFDDWYLPSIGETGEMIQFLLDNDLYTLHPNSRYWWSSTESGQYYASVSSVSSSSGYEPIQGITLKGSNSCCNYLKAIRQQNHSLRITSSYSLSFKDASETEQILISFPDSNKSLVQVLFDGLASPDDQFDWDFHGGEILEGDDSDPYLIGFDNGDYRIIKLTQYTQDGDTLNFESEAFRPQLFRKHAIDLPRFYRGTLSTTDFDGDGFEDFLLSGADTTQLYQNINGENFEPVPSPFPNLEYTFSDFGDFNNDGFPDLLMGGYDKTDSIYLTKLFQNMSGTGWEEQDLEIPGLVHGFCEWTDFNRDGYADFLVSGETMDSSAYTGLFKGNGTEAFEEVQTLFENVAYSTGSFGDYNNDNFPDLVISGSRDSVRYAKLYKNENGEFIEAPVNILPVNNGSATWADYNNDGWLDFSISGNKAEIVINPVPMQNSNDYNNINAVSFSHYLNLEDDNFQPSGNGSLGNNFINSNQAPADLDNDGREDVAITGQSAIATAIGGTGGGGAGVPNTILRKSKIIFYKSISSDSTLSFDDRMADIPSILSGPFNITDNEFQFRSVTLFDYNKDGRTDLLRGGGREEYPPAIYTNSIYRNNTPSTAPNSLQSEIISCDSIYLYWEHTTDDLTPYVALVYDLYIGTTPGAGDVLSLANNDQLQNNWFRLNRPLEKGTYYWSVRARDGARIFGDWSPEASFTIGVPTPTITFDGTQLISDANEGNQWYYESGLIPDATEPTYEPTEDGVYYCIAIDANGCLSDTSNVIEVVLTGGGAISNHGFSIFPNPTPGLFTIQGLSGIEEIQIYNLSGQLLILQPYRNEGAVTVKGLPKGVYLVRIVTPENIYFGKLLKY